MALVQLEETLQTW